ncbi:hypothetical protein Sa4125_15740 [Aureimonas sp. SA4125]|uniref:hypothetical protein n=1 Tax=Aureimonas sp. SA4125 TaxID=2826993 RepID=UPI001CC47E0C|nr:hypothetical protein [Aureimonas sp. SA4125]BDA84032.1 hypothetical protein Sa4125_15740 [Aureimonas sp. SA4125]
MKFSALLIGLAAGLASALLFAGLILQSPTAVGLSLAAPIPIFLASLGWGSRVGVVAALTASASLAAVTGFAGSGLILFATMSLPSAIIGHLAGLARPRETEEPAAAGPFGPAEPAAPAFDWYPLERILFAIAAIASVACLFIGWLFGYNASEIGPELSAALSAQMGATVDPAMQEQVQVLARLIVQLVPFIQPALLVITLVAGLHLSAIITRLSGRLARPRDDIPAQASLPGFAVSIFALAIAGCFVPSTLSTVAAVVAGAFGTAFTLVGLASVHRRSRGARNRTLILIGAYSAIVFLTFPLLAATALGVFETARPSSRGRASQ